MDASESPKPLPTVEKINALNKTIKEKYFLGQGQNKEGALEDGLELVIAWGDDMEWNPNTSAGGEEDRRNAVDLLESYEDVLQKAREGQYAPLKNLFIEKAVECFVTDDGEGDDEQGLAYANLAFSFPEDKPLAPNS